VSLAARLTGLTVTAIHLGSPPTLITVRLGTVRLCLGLRVRGQVATRGTVPVGRRAMVVAAGPIANSLSALAVLLLPDRIAPALAALFITGAARNLVPFRLGSSQSDGLRLVQLARRSRAETSVRTLLEAPDWHRRPDAADRLLAGCRSGAPQALRCFSALAALLSAAGRTGDLLWLHRLPLSLPGEPTPAHVAAIHQMEWLILTLPSGPDGVDSGLSDTRLRWALQHTGADDRTAMLHTLAVSLLRQGRHAEVEPMCAEPLAASLAPAQRATVLATVAMARHALRARCRDALAEALELDPAAALVGEAASECEDCADQ
jgi:hypothetical protein